MTAAVLAAFAAWLLVAPGDGTGRLARRRARALPPWVLPVPGAPSLRVRIVAAAAVALTCAVLLDWSPVAWVLALVLAPAVHVGLGRLDGGAAARRRESMATELPQALDLLVACLEAGLPPRVATAAVADELDGPMGEALAGVAARIAVGIPDADAWRAASDDGAFGAVGRDVARAAASGTALAPTLRRHAEDARVEHASLVQERARSVGVSSVLPLMVCFLPAFLLVGVVPIVAGVVQSWLGGR